MSNPPISSTGTSRTLPGAVSRLRIVVLGYVVCGPLGGLAWHHLQYVMGLARLGHDVYFIEDSNDYPSCYDPVRDLTATDPTYGLRFAARAFARVGLGDRWAYHDAHTARWLGPCADRALDICATSNLVLNLSGITSLRPWLMGISARVLVDTDPVFTQIRHCLEPAAWTRPLHYTAFFSFGENTGLPGSSIPQDGFPWQPTRRPVVLEAWPVTPGPRHGQLTTVMLWDSYPARDYAGRRYGTKSNSFDAYLGLPEQAGRIFELALGGATAPRALLTSRGWAVRDSREPTHDPWMYQRLYPAV